MELTEILVEEDDKYTAEILYVSTEPIKLFVHYIQCPYAEYIDLVDN